MCKPPSCHFLKTSDGNVSRGTSTTGVCVGNHCVVGLVFKSKNTVVLIYLILYLGTDTVSAVKYIISHMTSRKAENI